MSDRFDYEEARLDIIDNGCDPDYLDDRNPARRDKYLRDCGLNPRDYGSTYSEPEPPEERKRGFFDSFFSFDSPAEESSDYSSYSYEEKEEEEEAEPEESFSYHSSYSSSPVFEDTYINGNIIDSSDMELLHDSGYDESDLEYMTDQELADAMEDAGVDTSFYDF